MTIPTVHFLPTVCRIGLCARDYAREMVGMVCVCVCDDELDVWEYQCRGSGRRGLTFRFLLRVSNC